MQPPCPGKRLKHLYPASPCQSAAHHSEVCPLRSWRRGPNGAWVTPVSEEGKGSSCFPFPREACMALLKSQAPKPKKDTLSQGYPNPGRGLVLSCGPFRSPWITGNSKAALPSSYSSPLRLNLPGAVLGRHFFQGSLPGMTDSCYPFVTILGILGSQLQSFLVLMIEVNRKIML